MHLKMRNLILITLACSLTSCVLTKGQKEAFIAKYCPTTISIVDSVTIKEVRRDSTIYVTQTGPTVFVQSPCDSTGKLKPFVKVVKKNGLKVTVKSEAGILVAECDADSLKQVISGLNRDILTLHKEVKVIAPQCKEPHQNKWTGFTHWWTIISLIILFGYLFIRYGWKIVKTYLKL